MAELTEFLGLCMKDPVADAGDTFNIKTMLNDNFRKIDEFCAGTAGIITGTYVGTGDPNAVNPSAVTLTITPRTQLVVIREMGCAAPAITVDASMMIAVRGCDTVKNITYSKDMPCTWDETTLTWAAKSNDGRGSQAMLNLAGKTYIYLLLEG